MTQISWDIDRASCYHFREWDDGVALFLEGANSVVLVSPFGANLIGKFGDGPKTFEELLELVRLDYPDEESDTLGKLLDDALAALSRDAILLRRRS